MSNYDEKETSVTPPVRHRRMDRYIGREDTAPLDLSAKYPAASENGRQPASSYNAESASQPRDAASSYARRPVSPYSAYARPEAPGRTEPASSPDQREVRNVYDGYERPDEAYLQSDEALLSRRSRSFSRSSQNSDSVQTRMTQTGYQQTVRQQRPRSQMPAQPSAPQTDEPQPEETERIYQRPSGRTNQRPQAGAAAPARVRPPQKEEEELAEEEEREGGLPGFVKVILTVVLLAVLFCAGIYFFLPEGNSGIIGALNKVKSGITGTVDRVSGLIHPTEAPAQVLTFSCDTPEGLVGDECRFTMTTSPNVTSVGLCDRQGGRIPSSVTFASDLTDSERVWELSVRFSSPYADLVYASVQQGNNVWINSNQSVQVSYAAVSSEVVSLSTASPVPDNVIVQHLDPTDDPAETDIPPEPTPEPWAPVSTDAPAAGPTPYVMTAVVPQSGTDGQQEAQPTSGGFAFAASTAVPPDQSGSAQNGRDPSDTADADPVPGDEQPAETAAPRLTPEPAPAETPQPTEVPAPTFTPMPALNATTEHSALAMVDTVFIGGKQQKNYQRVSETTGAVSPIIAQNPGQYSFWDGGVFTFRGDNFHRNASFGTAEIAQGSMSILWQKELSSIKTSSGTLYGVGWTGQPAIIKWPRLIREMMDLNPDKKDVSALREVIVAAQDGNVYFVDLKDGQETRSPISIGYPLKGSVSVFTQYAPFISFGQGVSKLANGKTGAIGTYVYSLADNSRITFLNGRQSDNQKQYTTNGAFDGTALMIQDPQDGRSGHMVVAGENGLLYTMSFDINLTQEGLEVTANDPVYLRSKAKKSEDNRVGIEGSVAMYNQYVFMADSYGALRCVDTTTMSTVWAADMGDNTDASIALDFDEDGTLWLYTGNTNAYRLVKKPVSIRRINAMTGEIDWTYEISCEQDKNETSGCKASPVVGEKSISHLVFFTVNKLTEGGSKLIALNKETGSVEWEYAMSAEAVSSPVAVYNELGDSWIIQGDQSGLLHLLDARSGAHMYQLDLGGEIQGSPAVYRDILVIGTCSRGNANLYGIQLK